MLHFDTPVDSLAFGRKGTDLENLLFISHNAGADPDRGSELTMVDLATLYHIPVATGGNRGDIVQTTPDGRVLISQSHQVDVLSPMLAPRVAHTFPAADSVVALPLGSVRITLDHDMRADDATNAASVLHSENYELVGQTMGRVPLQGVAYDAASRTVLLTFEALPAEPFELRIRAGMESLQGLAMEEDHVVPFVAISDFTPFVDLHFSDTRSMHGQGTVAYDVTITNTSDYDLQVPLYLLLMPHDDTSGYPLQTGGQMDDAWIVDLSDRLAQANRLQPGESTVGETVVVASPNQHRVDAQFSVLALPTPNDAPVFDSEPVTAAEAGQDYLYEAVAHDPDGVVLHYLLYDGPAGMAVDSDTGQVTWSPTASSPAEASVTLQAYDSRGGHATQQFTVSVQGGDQAPQVGELPAEVAGREGEPLEIALAAIDPEREPLVSWVDHLPPGARYDQPTRTLHWTPGFDAAGTYPDVCFVVSDGVNEVVRTTTILVAPVNQPPVFRPVADRVVQEGDTVIVHLSATDPDGDAVTYASHLLPGGAFLDPSTGRFEWSPAYFQAGDYEIPIFARDDRSETSDVLSITVQNVNAAPVFTGASDWVVQEGQLLAFRAFAYDPDNPGFEPPVRLVDGSLTPLEGSDPTVTYTAANLPTDAEFDSDTALFSWVPPDDAAGEYHVQFTATDDGDGTGTSLFAVMDVPITVLHGNRPPEITAIDNQTLQRGEAVDLNVEAVDLEGNAVTLSLVNALPGYPLPAFVSLTDHGDGTGIVHLAPGFGDRGDHTLKLVASDDGDGGGPNRVASAEFSFVVTVDSPNEPPRLEPLGNRVALVNQATTFAIHASDLDEDPLDFTGDGLPAGATFTPSSTYGMAVFEWDAPVAGTYPLTFHVTDSGNGDPAEILSDSQTIQLVVRATNAAPLLMPVGSRSAAEQETLVIALEAYDDDGDPLLYRANHLPPGATLDTTTGVMTWTPNMFQAGTYPGITFTVTDGVGSASETIAIDVPNTNQPPVVVPLPPVFGLEDEPLSFSLTASDLDGDALSWFTVGALPAGARFDTRSGRFDWTPGYEQAGTYVLEFGARDGSGAEDTTQVRVDVANVNRWPELFVDNHTAIVGKPLEFAVRAADPDQGTAFTYSVVGLPDGATFDSLTGRFQWTPRPGETGDYPLIFTVSDGQATVSRAALVRSVVSAEPPAVKIELTPSFPAVPGQQVLVHAIADSVAEIAALEATVDGKPLQLDAQGRGKIVAPDPGKLLIEAAATDADGLTGQAANILRIRDPQDTQPPQVNLDSGLDGALLSVPTSLVGTVDDINLDAWQLEIASRDSEDFVNLATGEMPVRNGTLAAFDPATLRNGFYRLRLSATDLTGRSSQVETIIEINTPDKPNRLVREEQDLSVMLGGVPVTIVRRYDSLAPRVPGEFGIGWQLVGRRVDVQTSVAKSGRESLGVYEPFQVGTRVYVTLPDGRRVGFTFTPVKQALPGVTWYAPAFEPDAGVDWILESAPAKLTLARNRLYDLLTAAPYNPASPQVSGWDYRLTAPDGTVYLLDTELGVQQQITPTGGHIVHSDSGIHAGGESIELVRDERGRLVRITGPDGQQVRYRYSESGDLMMVRRLTVGETWQYGYTADHLLTVVSSPTAGGGQFIQYTPAPESSPINGDLGTPYRFATSAATATLVSGATDRYTFTLRSSELRSTETQTVLLGVTVQATPGSGLELAVPVIPGLTPLLSDRTSDQAFALYRLDRAGLQLLELSGVDGNTAGEYRVQTSILGDLNADGIVDAGDSQIFAGALGSSEGDPGYLPAADANSDGVIDTADSQLVAANYGFTANGPPMVVPTDVLTHEDLEVLVPLADLGSDPEGDLLAYRVTNFQHGTSTVRADGQSVVFLPDGGYTGPAAFDLLADDGFSVSAPATINVNVSDSPLVHLDFVERNPRLEVGETFVLQVVGDFADQEGVSLPAGYVSLVSTVPATATVSSVGIVRAEVEGNTVLLAQKEEIQAATALSVGLPEGLTEELLYSVGLDVYPASVSLSPNASRQLTARILESSDLLDSGPPVRYFVSDAGRLAVTPDGMLTAVGSGTVEVTVISGAAEALVPVQIMSPQPSPVIAGEQGTIVLASDGAQLALAPGAMVEDTEIIFAPIPENELPFAIPEFLEFAAGYEVEFGSDELVEPAQLMFPISSDVQEGTTLYLYTADHILQEDGQLLPVWLQFDVAIAGSDGFARTTSPPYKGLKNAKLFHNRLTNRTGTIAAFTGSTGLHRVEGALIQRFDDAILGALAIVENLANGVGLGAALSSTLGFTVDLVTGFHNMKVWETRLDRPPQTYDVTVYVDDKAVTAFEATINNLPQNTRPPLVEDLALEARENKTPKLTITGKYFGDPQDEVKVYFVMGGQDGATPVGASDVMVTPTSHSSTQLTVDVPDTVVLGNARVYVERNIKDFRGRTVETRYSNKLPVATDPGFAFVTRPADGSVSVIDARPRIPAPGNPGTFIDNDELFKVVADIPLDEPLARPRFVVATRDNSRAYVTLKDYGLAVIDAVGNYEIDTSPNSSFTKHIPLPQGSEHLAMSPDDKRVFVANARSFGSGGTRYGQIEVVDVDLGSDTFHQEVGRIVVPLKDVPTPPKFVPHGLRGVAVSSDGRYLLAASPNAYTYFRDRNEPVIKGEILVFDLDVTSPDYWLTRQDNGNDPAVQRLDVEEYPLGIEATPSPDRMLFTNFVGPDSKGIGILTRKGTTWTVSYPLRASTYGNATKRKSVDESKGLILGTPNDSFDVDNAREIVVHPDGKYAFVLGYALPNNSGFTFDSAIGELVGGKASRNHGIRGLGGYHAGSTVGVIKDPLSDNPKLVAATRPLPTGFPLDLDVVVTGQDQRKDLLFVTYSAIPFCALPAQWTELPPGSGNYECQHPTTGTIEPLDKGALFVYDAQAMIEELEASLLDSVTSRDVAVGDAVYEDNEVAAQMLDRHAINDVVDGDSGYVVVPIFDPITGKIIEYVRSKDIFNPDIDIKAALRVNPDSPRYSYDWEYDYDVPERSPIPLGGRTTGVAVQQQCFVELTSPLAETDDLTPEFRWKPISGFTIKDAKIFVSVFPSGDGLFSDDLLDPTTGEDLNPNRIVNGDWPDVQAAIHENPTGESRYELPEERTLTAGQDYYWGVIAQAEDGRQCRTSRSFSTKPLDLGTPFNGVTVITHGFQLNPFTDSLPRWPIELGEQIADAGGGELVFVYDKQTGDWNPANAASLGKKPADAHNKPLVLIADWVKESDISDSGFAEAAADSIFAALVKLDSDEGGDVFASPLHFIGHSRGAVVNSEIIQRLGSLPADMQPVSIQMTSLDAHDFEQRSLNFPLKDFIDWAKAAGTILLAIPGTQPIGAVLRAVAAPAVKVAKIASTLGVNIDPIPYADFQDPDVTVWENVDFADNYYQRNAGGKITATPIGRPVNADLDVDLDGRTGFTQDDLVLFGWGGPHSRVWQWYAGTTDLSNHYFPNDGERVFRRLADRDENDLATSLQFLASVLLPGPLGQVVNLLYIPFRDFSGQNPWYRGRNIPWYGGNLPASDGLWEGIREGWYFSDLGGGSQEIQGPLAATRVPVNVDNSDKGSPSQSPAVPIVFNGDFEWGTMHRKPSDPTGFFKSNRFPFSYELPGWSFHGGEGFHTLGDFEFSAALLFQTDLKATVTSFFKETLLKAWKAISETAIKTIGLSEQQNPPPEYTQQRWKQYVDDVVKQIDSLRGPHGQALDQWVTFEISRNELFKGSDYALMFGAQHVFHQILDSVVPVLAPLGHHIIDAAIHFDSITHNRMYMPENARVLTFDILAPIVLNPTSQIEVLFDGQSLGIVSLKPSFFAKNPYALPIDASLRNRVGTLEFRAIGSNADMTWAGISNLLNQFYFLDNVAVGTTLVAEASPEAEPAIHHQSISDLNRQLPHFLHESRYLWEQGTSVAEALPAELPINVTDLGSEALASWTGRQILIDDDAAGYGWFVDPTPNLAEEFRKITATTYVWNDVAEPAGIDLLTVVCHELGHVLGLVDSDASAGLMNGQLGTGIRRLPGEYELGILHKMQPKLNMASQNPPQTETAPSLDVNGDREVTPADVYIVMNSLNHHMQMSEENTDAWYASDTLPDVSGDGLLSPIDALLVIDALLRREDEGNAHDLTENAGSLNLTLATLQQGITPIQRPLGDASAEAEANPSEGIVNGTFDIWDPASAMFGWELKGTASVVDGAARLDEQQDYFSSFSQTFAVPQGTTALRFTLVDAGFMPGPNGPPDALEVALLDAATGQPLVGVAQGLTQTDALVNIQSDGTAYYGSQTAIPGIIASGDTLDLDRPLPIVVDLTGVPAGTVATLTFELLGFGSLESSVTIDNVSLVGVDAPLVDLQLDPGSDSGIPGDDLTALSPVQLVGRTDPQQEVLLDTDDDGFDDATTTADDFGQFAFDAVPLVEGTNTLRVQASNALGTARAARVVQLDTQLPSGVLVEPLPGAAINADAGFVTVQWTDSGIAGLDPSTFDPADVTVTGVSIDRAEHQGNGLVHYHYADDGQTLADGLITVNVVAGEVGDVAGNANTAASQSFRFDTQSPSGALVAPAPDALTNVDPGYVEIQWTDAGPAGLDETGFDAADVTVSGVSVDRAEHLGAGLVRYWYGEDGDELNDGTIDVTLVGQQVADTAGNGNEPNSFSWTLDTQAPSAAVIDPPDGSITRIDLGYVDVQWTDHGPAGLDPESFDKDDVTIAGVGVDRAEHLGDGLVRYWYQDDGETLADGIIDILLDTDRVRDRAGNANLAASASFVLDRQSPTGSLVAPAPGTYTNVDLGYFEIQWTDSGLAGVDSASFGPDDVQAAALTIDRSEDLGGGRVRYWYNEDGEELPSGTVQVEMLSGQIADLAGNMNAGGSASFTFDPFALLGTLVVPVPETLTNQDLGYVEIQWADVGTGGLNETTFDTSDVTVTGVTIDAIENRGGGLVRYVYGGDGETLGDGRIVVTLVAGAVTDQAGNENLASQAAFTLETQRPFGNLVAPALGTATNEDLGYVEVQWTDPGFAGLEPTSFDRDDLLVAGVSVDRAEVLSDGLVRYWYNDDGESLADGSIQVTQVAGQVADLAGNTNLAQSQSFTLDTQIPTGTLVMPQAGSFARVDLGYVEIQWTDHGLSGMALASFDSNDIVIAGVTVDRVEQPGDGLVRYWYGEDGDWLDDGVIEVHLIGGQVWDLAGNDNADQIDSFTLDTQSPFGVVHTPEPDSLINKDPGYVDVRWTDLGPSGLDTSSVDTGDAIIAGVTIDRFEVLEQGQVRYWYTDDGEQLADGRVEIELPAGAVADFAGNTNAALPVAFTLDTRGPIAQLVIPSDGAITSVDLGYVELQWRDQGLAGLDFTTLEAADITISGVTIDGFEDLGDGRVRYTYADDGEQLVAGETVSITWTSGAVQDRAGNTNLPGDGQFIFSSLPPEVDLNGPDQPGNDFAATFVEGLGAVALTAADLVVSDPDSAELTSATIVITNPLDQHLEWLQVDAVPTGMTAEYDPDRATLELTGRASPIDYASVIRTLRYGNASSDPAAESRVITIVVHDGLRASQPAIATVEVVPSNHSISGYVYVDVNNNGVKDVPELGLPHVPITLGGPISWTVQTASDGSYFFGNLPSGEYSIEERQPAAFVDGRETPGTPVDCVADDHAFYAMRLEGPSVHATDYNFALRGLRAELITKRLYLSSTPSAPEVTAQLDVLGDSGWFYLDPDFDANVSVELDDDVRNPVVEIYTDQWLPEGVSTGGHTLVATVTERQRYVIHVAGEDVQRAELSFQVTPAGIYTNAINALDVTADGYVTPIDALMVIDELNHRGAYFLFARNVAAPYYDANGDGYVTPLDALLIIDHLNVIAASPVLPPTAEGESGQVSPLVGQPLLLPEKIVGTRHGNNLREPMDHERIATDFIAGGPTLAPVGPSGCELRSDASALGERSFDHYFASAVPMDDWGPLAGSGIIDRNAPSRGSRVAGADEDSRQLSELDAAVEAIAAEVACAWQQRP